MTLPNSEIVASPAAEALLPELAGFRRPRLRDDVPILWRGAATVQLGDAVVLDRVTRAHVAWLTCLDGLRSPADLEQLLTLPATEARRLLRGALAAGAVEDAARIPDAVRWAAPEARDAAAQRYGAALQAYRDLDLTFDALSARERCGVAVLGDGVLAEQVVGGLAGAGLRPARPGDADIVVLADSPHPDVPAHFDHDLQDLPHLHVGVLGERAVVGPLVVPGRTSCLRCAHLHRRDADPAWPLLAVQWAHAVAAMGCPPVDPLLAQVAAGHAALLVRAWADRPDEPTRWADAALELRLSGSAPQRLPRPPHPLCGCRWPGG
jgi:bacteriocin biosynthesis cyclodehydratase domain-containing protein